MESRLTDDELLSNYGYDPDELLREVYGPILEADPRRRPSRRGTRRAA